MNQDKPFSKKEVMDALTSTPAPRLPLPAAYSDPAFNKCLMESAATPELIEAFDRLYGGKVGRIGNGPAIVQMIDKATGFQDEQLRSFAEFVHDSVYLRLPDAAINAFRIVEAAA